jgi:DHA1 family multidrug resistance protein-like MFS transporter
MEGVRNNNKEPRRVPWKVQMVMIWMSQSLSLMGFSFSLAFAPYFIQDDLGVGIGQGLEMWVAWFTSSTAVTMALAAPVWGWLADRHGKRIMLLRANFGGAVCMSLMGLVTSPGVLIALRSVQGLLTGTMTAAQTYLSASVPSDKRGLAMGGLSAAVYSGTMGGAFFGGLVAKAVGYRWAFGVSGVVLLLSGLLVLLGTAEPAAGAARKAEPAEGERKKERWRVPGMVWGVLGLVFAVSLARQFDLSFLPLLVQDIHGKLDSDVALWNGLVNACGSVAGLLAGVITGWLADRMRPFALMIVGSVMAALFSGSQMWVDAMGVLFPVRFFTIFGAGTLEPALNAWIARHVAEGRQGVVFGLSSTARSVGWSIGPLLAGAVATWRLRAVFGVSCAAYLVLGVSCVWMLYLDRKNGKAAA